MSYKKIRINCKEKSHGQMEYVGDGDYMCPVCGDVFHDYDFDGGEDDSERISVEEAAYIWMSNGKDEDFMFDYSEEELEDAL